MSKQLMKGNEALAEAALRAGCRFYSGYPITPQTEILEYLAKRMDEVGGTFVQTESELAGINMLLGAAAAGARALTSSAGPGFSLNQEGISYLVAADLPAVIINVMRIGTGLGDIAQGQGDYWQMTRGGGHGDYRTIVLAPASVQENCDMMTTAFDLAEKYRHPVLVASDAAIGQMVEGVELKDFSSTTSTSTTGRSAAARPARRPARSRTSTIPTRSTPSSCAASIRRSRTTSSAGSPTRRRTPTWCSWLTASAPASRRKR